MELIRRRLGEIAKIVGGATPSTKTPEYWDGDVPWITPKDLSGFDGIYIGNGSRNLSESGLRNSSAKILPAGTVLYTSRAPIGYVAIASTSVTTNQGFKSLILNDGFVPEFVFYLLKNSKSEIESHASGGTFAEISAKAMAEVEIEIPDEAHQRAIANVLLNLDKKIILNQEISRMLENLAQAIFKSWFVDFDPVKAKMSGEKPVGIDDATAALFPSSMEDSEVGPIPKGWAKTTIGDVLVKQKPGKLFDQKTTRSTGKIPVLDQGRSGVVGYHDDEPGYVASPENPVVVFANHTCSLRFISYPFSVIQNVFPILGSDISTYWLYFALQGKQNFDSYKGHWPDLVIKSIVRPSSEIADAFGHVVGPFMKQVWNFERQNLLLAEMRDGLLPRLISGELRIPQEMLGS
jgi:type I restriction enzyme S subunit